ncbi:MAG: ABC transporter permease [Lachnospiraceae bacterium]|nr:ABC transporter permease [Lachnospiraceae bacterium]
MTVFKATMRSLRAYYSTIIVYFLVFAVFGTIQSNAKASTSDTFYEDTVLDVAVIDYDNSTLSAALTEYLKDTQNLVDAKTEDPVKLNDNIRFGIYDYAIIIPEEFEENILKNETEDVLQYFSSADSAAGYLATEKIRTYLSDIVVYLESGYSEEEALTLASEQMEEIKGVEANVLSESDHSSDSFLSVQFTFNAYSLMMLLSVCIGSVLGFMKDKNAMDRIAVSGTTFKARSRGLILAVIVIGVGITTSMVAFTAITGFTKAGFEKFGYYTINEFILMLVGLGLAYFISSLTHEANIINMVANMIVLSMSFLCGVFVPIEFLSEKILSFSHFLPLYWYVNATNYINSHPMGEIFGREFLTSLLIELLFAGVFFVSGLIISRKKEQYAI